MQANTTTTQPPRLTPSALLFGAALVASIIFAAAFKTAPQRVVTADPEHEHTMHPGQHIAQPDPHAAHQAPTAPAYYAGGLWSEQLGFSHLSELAALLAAPGQPIICKSLRWDNDKLVVIDTTPPIAAGREGEPVVFISIDYNTGRAPEAFPLAVQTYIETITNADKFVSIPPIPGPDPWPETPDPDDWTFLWIDDFVYWEEIKPKDDLKGLPHSGYLLAWLEEAVPDYAALTSESIPKLIAALSSGGESKTKTQAMWALSQRGPYEVIPAIDAWLASAKPQQRSDRLHIALTLRRTLGVHADALIAEAAASEDATLRRHAARAISDLADQTTGPLGKLTKLAEDREMAVRQEAMLACRQIPGRRAAGVALLVETYEMDPAMRSAFDQTMAMLRIYGEPVEADSRINKLRRMTLAQLTSEERDALVARVMLEREELPDTEIVGLINQLAKESKTEPLDALIALLDKISPKTLRRRPPLLQTLAGWDKAELKQRIEPLGNLARESASQALRQASAAALIQSLGIDEAREQIASASLFYDALKWVQDKAILDKLAPTLADLMKDDSQSSDTRIAIIEALPLFTPKQLGDDTYKGLFDLARGAKETDLRFAAIRTTNALPGTLQPDDMDAMRLTVLTIKAVPGKVKYDLAKLTVPAGRPVELTLINPDTMDHNFVITKPGRAQEIGVIITQMDAAAAAEINYIPDSDAVLHHTDMVKPGQAYTLRFISPAKAGNYDYVCSFPGHYTTMIGVLEVVAP